MSDDPPIPIVDPPKPPIIVDPSVLGSSAAMAVRQVALVGGGAVSAIGYVHSKDWGGLFGYLSGDGAPAVFVALATIGVFLYGQLKGLRDKRDAIVMARKVDDSVAVVKGEEKGTPSE